MQTAASSASPVGDEAVEEHEHMTSREMTVLAPITTWLQDPRSYNQPFRVMYISMYKNNTEDASSVGSRWCESLRGQKSAG